MKSEHAAIVVSAHQDILRQQQIIETAIKDVDSPEITGEISNIKRFSNAYKAILHMIANPTPYGDERFIDGNSPTIKIQVEKDGKVLKLFLQLGVVSDISGQYISANWNTNPTFDDACFRECSMQSFGNFTQEDIQSLTNLEWSLIEYQKAISGFTDEELLILGFPQKFVDQLNSTKTKN